MLRTVSPEMFTSTPLVLNALRTPGPQRRRIQPTPAFVTTAGGELQPMKYVVPSCVVTLNRGAPAPQLDPRGSFGVTPGLRRSYPSSVRTVPFTPSSTANAEA